MTAPLIAAVGLSPSSSLIPNALRKKRVLLVDASTAKRELRAEAMRKLGMDVDCASDISEARCWWKADLYNLVLINLENENAHRDKFCDDVRGATPPQQLAFLVGKPEYLADAPRPERTELSGSDGPVNLEKKPAVPYSGEGSTVLSFGIMEASRRISAVRSASIVRLNAMRNRPVPPRDLEVQHSRHNYVNSAVPTELQKEEIL